MTSGHFKIYVLTLITIAIALSFVPSANADSPPTDYIEHWSFDADYIGERTGVACRAIGTTIALTAGDGKHGKALQISSGTAQATYLECDYKAALDIGDQPFTVVLWYKSTVNIGGLPNDKNAGALWAFSSAGQSGDHFMHRREYGDAGGGSYVTATRVGSSSYRNAPVETGCCGGAVGSVPVANVYMLSVDIHRGLNRMANIMNGTELAISTYNPVNTTTNNFGYISANWSFGGAQADSYTNVAFSGEIDEVFIYNRSLTAGEVAWFKQNITMNGTPVVVIPSISLLNFTSDGGLNCTGWVNGSNYCNQQRPTTDTTPTFDVTYNDVATGVAMNGGACTNTAGNEWRCTDSTLRGIGVFTYSFTQTGTTSTDTVRLAINTLNITNVSVGYTGAYANIFSNLSITSLVSNTNTSANLSGVRYQPNSTDWRKNNVSLAILHLTFNENTNTTGGILDHSTYGFNYSAGSKSTWQVGRQGGQARFNTTPEEAPVSQAGLFINATWTVAGWYNFTGKPATTTSAMFGDAVTTTGFFNYDDASNLFNFSASNTNSDCAGGTYDWVTNGLRHVVVVANGSNTIEVYVDGVWTTQVTGCTHTQLNVSRIGSGLTGTAGSAWNGSIDEFMVFNQTLNADQAKGLYDSYTQNEGPVMLHSSFLSVMDQWAACAQTTNSIDSGTVTCSSPVLILDDNLTITRVNQTPADINFTSVVTGTVNVTYSISPGPTGFITFYHKTNTSTSDVTFYQNGTAFSGWLTGVVNTTPDYKFILTDNKILPATYNQNETMVESTQHQRMSMVGTTSYYSMGVINMSDAKNYTVLEFMMNATSMVSNPLIIHYCNSTYTTGNPTTSPFCTEIASLASSTPYAHSHSAYSSHVVVVLNVNTTGKTINNAVGLTSTGQFLYHSTHPTFGWYRYTIPTACRVGAAQQSNNTGTTWTDLAECMDGHVHQFDGTDTFRYYLTAQNQYGETFTSTVSTDLLELGGIPPSQPEWTSPTTGIYRDVITYTHTASFSAGGYGIWYNVTLRNVTTGDLVSILATNTTNLTFERNSTAVPDGRYRARVVATDALRDETSPSSTENITIDNTRPGPGTIYITGSTTYSPVSNTSIAAQYTDANGVVQVNLTIDATEYPSLNTTSTDTYNRTIVGLGTGTHNITFRTVDTAGNAATNTTTWTISSFSIGKCSPFATGYNHTILNGTIFSDTTFAPVNSTTAIILSTYYQTPENNITTPLNWTNTPYFAVCSDTPNITLSFTGTFTFQDYNETFSTNTYILSNATGSSTTPLMLNLFLTPGTTPIVFRVVDFNNQDIIGATLIAQTIITGSTSYQTISSGITGQDGKVSFNMQSYRYYKMLVYSSGGTLLKEYDPLQITTNTYTLVIPTLSEVMIHYDDVNHATCSVYYNNATKNATFTFGTSNGNTIRGCLQVRRMSNLQEIVHGSSCVTSSTGAIYIPLNETTGTYSIQGTIDYTPSTNDDVTYPCGPSIIISFDRTNIDYGRLGLFLTIIMFFLMTLIGSWSPLTAVIMGTLGFVTASIMFFVTGTAWFSIASIIGIIVLAGIWVFRIKNGWGS